MNNLSIDKPVMCCGRVFGSSLCVCKVFKCVAAKDDEAKACVLFVLSCSVKRSSKAGITLGFLH